MIPAVLAWLMAGYPIAGIVRNSVTGQPVSGARVTVAPLEHRDQRIPFLTDKDGRFTFAGMAQGKYELLAQAGGFLTGGFPGAVVTGPGRRADAILVSLSPPAVISGRVLDDAGEPVAGATVQLLRESSENGRHGIAALAVAETADTGEYRFGSLSAGKYFVAASGSPWYAKYNQTHGDAPPRAMTHTGYRLRFYPDAGEPLQLAPGQQAAAGLTLQPVPALTIQVHVTGADDVTRQFELTAAGPGGHQVLVRRETGAGNLHNLWSVPPGQYTLRVKAANGSGSWYAQESIEAGSADLEVHVSLREAPSIDGQVVLDGGGTPDLAVLLTDSETGNVMSVRVAPDGKFAVPALAPHRYRLALGSAGCFLKGWTVEGARRDGDMLEIPAGAATRLKLTAATGTGSVNGIVERGGRPLAGTTVVLADTARPDNGRSVPSNSDGSYEFAGVPPGVYSLSVLDGGAAKRVRVEPGRALTERLETAPAATAGRPASASPTP